MVKKSQDINYISKALFPKSFHKSMADEMKEKMDNDKIYTIRLLKEIKFMGHVCANKGQVFPATKKKINNSFMWIVGQGTKLQLFKDEAEDITD